METNSSGAQSASSTYYAYGSTRVISGTLQTDRTFTGQKADGTGLLYYNARYYDPALGTFLSPDTLVPDPSLVVNYNRFLYTRANPLRFSDPSGHCEKTIGDEDYGCWDLLRQLLHGERTKGIYVYEEVYQLKSKQIQTLLDHWATNDFDPYDALLLGASGGFVLDTPLGFNASFRGALEFVANRGEMDVFFVGGASLDFSVQKFYENTVDPLRVFSKDPALKLAGPQAALYVGQINNLSHNGEYVGQTQATETSFGAGLFTFSTSEFHTPDQPNGPVGSTIGWSPSAGVNLGKSAVTMHAVRLRDVWGLLVDLATGN